MWCHVVNPIGRGPSWALSHSAWVSFDVYHIFSSNIPIAGLYLKVCTVRNLTVAFLKKVSGIYKGLYICRGGLYTILNHSFIYLVAMCNIEENMTSIQKQILKIWKQTSQIQTKTRRATWMRSK